MQILVVATPDALATAGPLLSALARRGHRLYGVALAPHHPQIPAPVVEFPGLVTVPFPFDPGLGGALFTKVMGGLPYRYSLWLEEQVSLRLVHDIRQQKPNLCLLLGNPSLVYADVIRYQAPEAPIFHCTAADDGWLPSAFIAGMDASAGQRFLRQQGFLLKGQVVFPADRPLHKHTLALPPLLPLLSIPFDLPPVVEGSVIVWADEPLPDDWRLPAQQYQHPARPADEQAVAALLMQAEIVVAVGAKALAEAAQLGRPCVSTPATAAELGLAPDEHLLLADSGPALFAAVERLRAERGLRSLLGANAREHLLAQRIPAGQAQQFEAFVAAG